MMHLVWTKSTSDEGKGVQNHLIECYKGLFFDAPDHLSTTDAATYIARNLTSLTYGSTLAELTSLEQLLCNMMKQGEVSPAVIGKLWQVYGFQKKDISKTQRRGAIIILGMLALADSDIVTREIDTLLNIGLGHLGRADLELARYTCIALQRLNMKHRKGKIEFEPELISKEHLRRNPPQNFPRNIRYSSNCVALFFMTLILMSGNYTLSWR
jgi:condensin complex subunit 1